MVNGLPDLSIPLIGSWFIQDSNLKKEDHLNLKGAARDANVSGDDDPLDF